MIYAWAGSISPSLIFAECWYMIDLIRGRTGWSPVLNTMGIRGTFCKFNEIRKNFEMEFTKFGDILENVLLLYAAVSYQSLGT